MARINLLPWREQLREERKREFFVLLMGVVIIAGGILFLIDRNFRSDIRYQQSRNDFLRREVEAAGFRVVAEGNFLRNPQDPRDRNTPNPPMPKDEFVLKFVKP